MKKMIIVASVLWGIASFQPAAQAQSGVYYALNQFLGTEFFTEFMELRKRAVESVQQFKRIEHQYSSSEVQVVKDAYNSSAEYFNLTLSNIKTDLLIKEKRKYIIRFPDSYSKQIEADLYRAKEFYRDTYQKEVANLTDGKITGTAFLTLLPSLINNAKMAVGIIQKIQAEVRKFNEGLLDKYLMEAYRFPMWDEIQ